MIGRNTNRSGSTWVVFGSLTPMLSLRFGNYRIWDYNMSHTHVLVKYNDNWADEFGVQGYRLFTKEGWEKIDRVITENFTIRNSFEFYFGTNESIDYDSEKDLRGALTIEYLTDAEVETTFLYLPKEMGIFPYFEYMTEDLY